MREESLFLNELAVGNSLISSFGLTEFRKQ